MSDPVASEAGFARAPGSEWAAIEGEGVRRVGVIDVGSNSVRLVVFDGVARSPAYFYNEKVLCGLGIGLNETGQLNPEGRDRALAAIRRLVALSRIMQVTALTGVATAAVREASDGAAFCRMVARTTGLTLDIATGAQEAELSAKGVLLGWPKATGMVCDIGGASMELARVDDGVIGAAETSPLGPLRLAGLDGDGAIEAAIDRGIEGLIKTVGRGPRRLFLVGGSWRAIARLDMERCGYPLKVLHEYKMTPDQLLETCAWIGSKDLSDLKGLTDTSTARLQLVPLAARVLAGAVRALVPGSISVSSYGLREGLLYEKMPASLRARDPLLEASRHMEQTRARFPGFGASLYDWLQPLYADAPLDRLRLIRAACYLHDTNWRAHPDYRAEVCFETVTRANLSGLDHAGRVFLGAAILNRYKSSRSGFRPDVLELLSETEESDAETLGKALRLGAMLSGAAPVSLENTHLSMTADRLTLTLSGPARALMGEAVERRLKSLAARLGRSGEIALIAPRPRR